MSNAFLRSLSLFLLVAFTVTGCDLFNFIPAPGPNPGPSINQFFLADVNGMNDGPGIQLATGKATFSRTGDLFTAETAGLNMAPSIMHAQHVHAGAVCPPPYADTNNDGFIDVVEGLPYYGAILIPLDSDLSTQPAGAFPTASSTGSIGYIASTSYQTLLDDLQAPDPNPGDAVVKLGAGKPLDLFNRTVVFHGVAPGTPLPNTVQSIGGLPPQATLPVACGRIDLI